MNPPLTQQQRKEIELMERRATLELRNKELARLHLLRMQAALSRTFPSRTNQ